MKESRNCCGIVLVVAIFLVALFGCAAVTEELKPAAGAPNLVGTWKGEWGGNMTHPIEVVVEKQQEGKVSGKVTVSPAGSKATHSMTGIVGTKPDGSLWVVLTVAGPSTWNFTLKVASEKRLEGTGRSPRHFGPLTLNRD